MKSIEERATEYLDKRCPSIERLANRENLSNDVRRSMLYHCYNDYKTGATEQKAIVAHEIDFVSKRIVDKACEWLKARNVLTDASIEGFRKAMEEEQ